MLGIKSVRPPSIEVRAFDGPIILLLTSVAELHRRSRQPRALVTVKQLFNG